MFAVPISGHAIIRKWALLSDAQDEDEDDVSRKIFRTISLSETVNITFTKSYWRFQKNLLLKVTRLLAKIALGLL